MTVITAIVNTLKIISNGKGWLANIPVGLKVPAEVYSHLLQ